MKDILCSGLLISFEYGISGTEGKRGKLERDGAFFVKFGKVSTVSSKTRMKYLTGSGGNHDGYVILVFIFLPLSFRGQSVGVTRVSSFPMDKKSHIGVTCTALSLCWQYPAFCKVQCPRVTNRSRSHRSVKGKQNPAIRGGLLPD